MKAAFKNNSSEWLLGGVMFLLCTVLTALQYQWTGQIARAEMLRMRGNLLEQAQALTRAFDAELGDACDQLVPDRNDFKDQSYEAAELARFRTWQATHPHPIFKRIGLGHAVGDEVELELLDQASGKFVGTNWPAEWSELHINLADKINGHSPPFEDQRGLLLEFPISNGGRFPGGPPGGPRGSFSWHWLILEIDIDAARDHWFPALVAKYINLEGHVINDIRIKTGTGRDAGLLFSTTSTEKAQSPVMIRFNQLGKTDRNSRGPAPPGGRWLLEAWQRPGVLDAVVESERKRNLAVAVAINVLMFVTGLALVRNTRRARLLAEQQLNFVANVSHELRTPLTVIRGAAHNLKRGVINEPGRIDEYSGLIIQHADQLTEMVEQLLTLAGAQKGRSAALQQVISLADVLTESVAVTAHDTQAATCEVHLELPPTLPPLMGDAAALRRAFQNLISNAAKHGGGGWIGIAAALDEVGTPPMVEIQVADHGPGIPAGEETEIFKPFYRGALALEKQTRGSGLGLSLVKEIVEAHGGTVSARNLKERGAVFIVRLPVARTPIKK